jgi:hypothetical protein
VPPENFFSFSINVTEPVVSNRINPLDGRENSVIIYQLKFARNPLFYIRYYCIPSFLFIVMTYCSFWID